MGEIEKKIKEKILQEIFSETTKIYEFIENRFDLDEKKRDELIKTINTCNNDVTILLKDCGLK